MEKSPARTESELLKEIYRYITEHDEFPDNSWLGRQLGGRSDTHICNLKKKLEEKGYLHKQEGIVLLTEKAYQFLERQSSIGKIVLPLQVPILGKVQAGPKKQDEMAVDMLNSVDDAPTVTIPRTSIDSTVFVLQVEGQSMEHEHIFDGDSENSAEMMAGFGRNAQIM